MLLLADIAFVLVLAERIRRRMRVADDPIEQLPERWRR